MKRARRATVSDLSKPVQMGSKHSFFKCILSSEKMAIPRAFVVQMQGAIANRVVLRDCYENLWPVEVAINGDDWCFSKGRPRFYRENSLEEGDFSVFEYKCENLLDFKSFGPNACEKQDVRAKEEVDEYDESEEEYQELINIVDDDEGDDVEDEDEEDEDDDDYVEEEDVEEEEQVVYTSRKIKATNKSKPCPRRMCHINLSRCNTSGVGRLPSKLKYRKKIATEKKGKRAPMYKLKKEEVEDEELEDNDDINDASDEEEEKVNISRKIIKANSKSKSSLALGRNLSRGQTFGIVTIPSRRKYKKKDIPDCYGADIFKSGLASQPKNPYFVTRSRVACRQNELYIPKDVIVDYNLNIPEKLLLD